MKRTAAVCLIGVAGCGGSIAAPEVDRDAYWIESTVCAVTTRLRADTAAPEVGRLLAGLVGAPANCAGSPTTVAQPGSVATLLQRGFRITAAQHQIVPWASASSSTATTAATTPATPAPNRDPEPTLLMTALFVLEKPAVRLAPIPK